MILKKKTIFCFKESPYLLNDPRIYIYIYIYIEPSPVQGIEDEVLSKDWIYLSNNDLLN